MTFGVHKSSMQQAQDNTWSFFLYWVWPDQTSQTWCVNLWIFSFSGFTESRVTRCLFPPLKLICFLCQFAPLCGVHQKEQAFSFEIKIPPLSSASPTPERLFLQTKHSIRSLISKEYQRHYRASVFTLYPPKSVQCKMLIERFIPDLRL